ncbi:MAG: TonB-dependent receptor [Calditrichaeota bacterium]|nr:TonB-dependent receptor [Calditrichota bacterium]
MSRRLLFLTVLLSMLPVILLGQSSGKLVGVVTDQKTGEPLPGVNVSLDGTTFGAATDVDGYYVILNVPVGTYTIRANFIGYAEQAFSGVRVSASTTTEINFSLSEAVIEGETVVVTATKPLVEKNTTSSVSLVTSAELESIPVRGFNQVIALQNSVVVQDDEVYIRGGRSDEVGYYLDGASSTSPISNTQTVHIIQEAVEEFQVMAGGYNAEFGNANAGIIRTELRTGGSQYKASIDFQTDKFAGEGEQFLNTYSYRHHTGVATLSGPLFSNKIRFFVAGENTDQGDRQVRFSEGFSFTGLEDSNPQNPNVTNHEPDIIDLKYPAGFTPQNGFERWAANGTLLFDYQPISLRLSGVYKNETTDYSGGSQGLNTPMLNILNDRYMYDEDESLLLGLKLTHVLSPKTLYSVRFNLYNRRLERFDSYFGNDWALWYDRAAVAAHTDSAVVYRTRWNPEYDYRINGIPMSRNGDPSATYRLQKEQYLGGAFDFTSQVGRHHELKVGLDARQYTMRRIALLASAVNVLGEDFPDAERFDPSLLNAEERNTFARSARVANYGYDFFGNELDDGFDGARKPIMASAYFQDKVEYNDLIVNFGLRYDYFDTDDYTLKNPTSPLRDGNDFILESEWKEVDPFQQVSPRLGFSFPVSEKTVFYLQYGKFIQMTELNNIYFGGQDLSRQIVVAGNFFANPIGFGLEPTRTTAYEIGFRQQLSDVAAMDVAGFYRNVIGQIQVGVQDTDPTSGISQFAILQNGDFATTKGLDLKLTMRRTNRLQAQFNYTYSNAEGTGSNETSYRSAVDRNTATPTTVNPLDFNQTHTGAINLDYRYGKNDGGSILKNAGANVLLTFSSGHAYTAANPLQGGQADPYTAGVGYMSDTRSRQALEALGASTTPWNFITDLRLDKSFDLTSRLNAQIYMRVTNLFNAKNVLNVYQATGSATDDGFINDRTRSETTISANGGQQYIDLYNALNTVNGQSYWDNLGLQLYGHPRQIFFGLKLSY